MKKKFIFMLMFILVFSLISCDSKVDEYMITGTNLIPTKTVDDHNRVFYEIFTGSFSDSNQDGYGDLRGIINRLDYLNDGDPTSGKSLGVGGIWLTPIFKSPSYHKYDAADYYQIDSEFGTMEDLKVLIEECHKRDIKLIIDLVINHSSTENEWFINFKNAHINNDVANEYYDFYSYVDETGLNSGATYKQINGTNHYYECNFSTHMPEMNFDNMMVRQTIIEIAKYYLAMGIDGFRLDAAKYIYYKDDIKNALFWTWFIEELKKVKEDVYLVGEVWDQDYVIEEYLNSGLNCFSFATSETSSSSFIKAAKYGNVNNVMNYIEKFYTKNKTLQRDIVFVPFLSNHDMDRIGGYLSIEEKTAQMAASLYLLCPGSPFIYYGEEIGMFGSKGTENTDANRRLAMLWGDKDTVKDPIGTTYLKSDQTNGTVQSQIGDPNSLYTHYKKLIMIRNANPEIARGEFVALKSPNNSVSGFTSTYEGSTVCVIHNTKVMETSIDLSTLTTFSFSKIRALIGENASLDGNILTISGQTSVVLK